MEAAVERPPHLKAIMPIAGTYDLYESATHHGLVSSGFLTPFLFMIGMTSGHTNKLWQLTLSGDHTSLRRLFAILARTMPRPGLDDRSVASSISHPSQCSWHQTNQCGSPKRLSSVLPLSGSCGF
jgi:predicted acyl esterase